MSWDDDFFGPPNPPPLQQPPPANNTTQQTSVQLLDDDDLWGPTPAPLAEEASEAQPVPSDPVVIFEEEDAEEKDSTSNCEPINPKEEQEQAAEPIHVDAESNDATPTFEVPSSVEENEATSRTVLTTYETLVAESIDRVFVEKLHMSIWLDIAEGLLARVNEQETSSAPTAEEAPVAPEAQPVPSDHGDEDEYGGFETTSPTTSAPVAEEAPVAPEPEAHRASENHFSAKILFKRGGGDNSEIYGSAAEYVTGAALNTASSELNTACISLREKEEECGDAMSRLRKLALEEEASKEKTDITTGGPSMSSSTMGRYAGGGGRFAGITLMGGLSSCLSPMMGRDHCYGGEGEEEERSVIGREGSLLAGGLNEGAWGLEGLLGLMSGGL